jgi:hypothetical protein
MLFSFNLQDIFMFVIDSLICRIDDYHYINFSIFSINSKLEKEKINDEGWQFYKVRKINTSNSFLKMWKTYNKNVDI